MSNDIRHGMIVYPHVAGWDAPTATRPALTIAGTVALFDNAALREFAQAFVNADMIKADYLIDALIDALEMPHAAAASCEGGR